MGWAWCPFLAWLRTRLRFWGYFLRSPLAYINFLQSVMESQTNRSEKSHFQIGTRHICLVRFPDFFALVIFISSTDPRQRYACVRKANQAFRTDLLPPFSIFHRLPFLGMP